MARESRLRAHAALRQPALADLVALDDAAFRKFFARSPVKRIGVNQFRRNVLYALGNSGDLALQEVVQPWLSDPDPVVADAAAWATARLNRGGPPSS